MGWLSRLYSLTIDALAGVEIVTAAHAYAAADVR